MNEISLAISVIVLIIVASPVCELYRAFVFYVKNSSHYKEIIKRKLKI